MLPFSPKLPTDWFTSVFWQLYRRRFVGLKRYEVDRIHPHDGPVLPADFHQLGERRGEPDIPLSLYTGPDPAGRNARYRAIAELLLSRFPIQDRNEIWSDDTAARSGLESLFSGLLSQPTARPRDPSALIHLATSGAAAHRLRRDPSGSGFIVDLAWLSRYPVRQGFTRYGARLRLNEGLDSVAIEVDGRVFGPSDLGFETARDRFEASLLVAVISVDHLLRAHLACGGGLVMAVRAGTPVGHPLRAALAPFTFNSSRMNEAALDVLASEGGYFHRLFALTWEGLAGLFADGLGQIDPRPLPERMSDVGLSDRVPDLPFWEESLGWWTPLARHAERLVDTLVEPDVAARMMESLTSVSSHLWVAGDPKSALKMMLSFLLYEVTVGHRHASNIAVCLEDPRWMPVKIGRGSEVDRHCKHDLVQKTLLSFIGTRQRAPRFTDDIASRLPPGPLREGWHDLDRELAAWEAGLAARNARRSQPFEALRREHVATSAAV